LRPFHRDVVLTARPRKVLELPEPVGTADYAVDGAAKMFAERCFGRGLREFGFPSLRCGKNPHRWNSRRTGGRVLRYRLKALASHRDVPDQSLLKVLLAKRVKQEETKQALTLRPAVVVSFARTRDSRSQSFPRGKVLWHGHLGHDFTRAACPCHAADRLDSRWHGNDYVSDPSLSPPRRRGSIGGLDSRSPLSRGQASRE
jgi:hypothetical protein